MSSLTDLNRTAAEVHEGDEPCVVCWDSGLTINQDWDVVDCPACEWRRP